MLNGSLTVWKAAVVSLLVVGFVLGCETKPPPVNITGGSATDDVNPKDPIGVTVLSSDGAGNLTINNNLRDDMVVFAGQIVPNNILGMVLAQRRGRTDLGSKVSGKGAVLLRGIPLEIFETDPLGMTNDDVVWFQLVPSEGEMVVDINKRRQNSGGNYGLQFTNESKFLLEIRRDAPNGPVLTVLPPNHYAERTVWFQSNDKVVYFPLYYTYNPAEDEIIPFKDVDWGDEGDFANPEVEDFPIKRFKGIGIGSGTVVVNKVVLRIELIDSSGKNGELRRGQSVIKNQRGIETLRAGRTETYVFDVEKDEETLIFAGYKLAIGLGEEIDIREQTFNKGYRYQILVDDAGFQVRKETRIDVGELNIVNE